MTLQHQAYYQATVPALSEPWVQIVEAGQDGWTTMEAQWLNSAGNLLLSALKPEDPIVALLRGGLPIRHGGLSPEANTEPESPAWYYQGVVYIGGPHLCYLLISAVALGHELQHAVHRHDQLPPRSTGLKRIRMRCEWEIAAHSAEQEVNAQLHSYLTGVQGVDMQVRSGWLQEMIYFLQNADSRLAYYRTRLAILDVAELLTQVAHHDSSVADPRHSQLFVVGQHLCDKHLSKRSTVEEMANDLDETRSRISGFGIPDILPQKSSIDSALESWETHSAAGVQAHRQMQHQLTMFEFLK